MIPWIKKYKPKSTKDVIGQNKAIAILKEFVQHPKNGMLLYGPSGCGKTAMVQALAEELNYELVDINASDVRNKDAIESLLGSVIKQQSFFHKGKLILIDEVDASSGTKDRGGVQQIVKIIQESSFPIICTCTNPNEQKLKPIRKLTQSCECVPLKNSEVSTLLANICKNENMQYEESVLNSIAIKCTGDVRAAINDLQLLSAGSTHITQSDFEELTQRAKVQTIESALTTIYKSTDIEHARNAFNEVEEDVDQQFLWLDHNTPFEYTHAGDLVRAYGCLSKADVYRRRIRRRQHWRFLVYINALLTAGITSSKKEVYKKPPVYKQTTRLLKIWQVNMSVSKKKSIASKIAINTHTSSRQVFTDFEYYRNIIKNKDAYALEIGLDKDEIAYCKR